MKKLLIFVLFLIGCSEEYVTIQKRCSPFRMTISDAIPIQFWINGVETYNQKEVCGITQACYCQPFECDDEIRIQVNDTSYSSLTLKIYDSADSTLASLSFSRITNSIWQLSFVPSELNICDEQIRLEIHGSLSLLNQEYTTNVNSWENFGSGNAWSWNNDAGNGSARSNTIGVTDSKFFRQAIAVKSLADGGLTLSVDLEYRTTVLSAGISRLKIFGFLNGVENELVEFILTTAGVSTVTNQVLAVGEYDYIGYKLEAVNGEHAADMHYFRVTYTELSANSDCIDIKESHECTQLIRYDNAKDFADIEYSDFSPTAEFYIRIPAIFFHERNTEETERFETSGQTIVRLRDEIKIKRLLEVGFMPDYMHRKLLLILAHDTIEIDGEAWVRNDPYEKVEGNRHYPLKKANVLLTQQGYIKRNIL